MMMGEMEDKIIGNNREFNKNRKVHWVQNKGKERREESKRRKREGEQVGT
jgi:hypothetical protein